MPQEALSQILPERRKDERHEVQLKGGLRCGAKTLKLEIGDLSRSGALVLMKDPPPSGTLGDLFIEDYGPIPIRVMHAGTYFCGVAFTEPNVHQPRLNAWMGMEAAGVAADAA